MPWPLHRAARPGLQRVLRVVYPPQCLNCRTQLAEEGLCGACYAEMPFLTGLTCDACAAPLPGQSDRGELCDTCLRTARPWAQGRAPLLYSGTARRLVLGLKHGDRHDIATPAARWMVRSCGDLDLRNPLLVPIPLHPIRLARRRYNQAALLAHAMARHADWAFCLDALCRVRRTPSLDGQSRDARFATLSSAITFHSKRRSLLAGRDVVLVDDVMTTGATLGVATSALYAAGANRVCVVVLARVADPP